MNEWLEDKADTVTRWETDTRCNMDYSVELEKVKQGLEQIRNLFEINGIKKTLREELSNPDTKERLRSYFPKGYEPEDAFEWNCYFQIYRKQSTEKQ